VSGNMVPAFEIMHVNSTVRGLIRDCKNHQINNAIQAGRAEGMISMDQAIHDHVVNGLVSKETGLNYADNREQFLRHL